VPKKTVDYETWLSEELQDPEIAANYLSAAIEDSPEMFLEALKDVSQAHQVATVARKSGVKRESLYKAFSGKGNPTFCTLHSVLRVFGVKMRFEASSIVRGPHRSGSRTKRIGHARIKIRRSKSAKR